MIFMDRREMERTDGRDSVALRPMEIITNYLIHPDGSALVRMGNTWVVCTATVEHGVPAWLRGQGKGWITAEYDMLPTAGGGRSVRDRLKGFPSGRSSEIGRLVGRALRAVTDLVKLGDNTIWIDCDVLQADGGTRTASVNGGLVALNLALKRMREEGTIEALPLKDYVGAVSCALVEGELLLDVDYEEDSKASAEFNVVATSRGEIVDFQGSGEGACFDRKQMDAALQLALSGIQQINQIQLKAIGLELK